MTSIRLRDLDKFVSQRRTCRGCENWENLYIGPDGLCSNCRKDLEVFWDNAEVRQDNIGQNGNDGEHYDPPGSAPDILMKAHGHIADRAATYDTDAGERSVAKAIAIFNAAEGLDLSERQGWLFMVCLKMARSTQPGHNPDDFEDMSAYSALLGECAGRGQ